MLLIVICLLKGGKNFKFKADNKNANFPTQFCFSVNDDPPLYM